MRAPTFRELPAATFLREHLESRALLDDDDGEVRVENFKAECAEGLGRVLRSRRLLEARDALEKKAQLRRLLFDFDELVGQVARGSVKLFDGVGAAAPLKLLKLLVRARSDERNLFRVGVRPGSAAGNPCDGTFRNRAHRDECTLHGPLDPLGGLKGAHGPIAQRAIGEASPGSAEHATEQNAVAR